MGAKHRQWTWGPVLSALTMYLEKEPRGCAQVLSMGIAASHPHLSDLFGVTSILNTPSAGEQWLWSGPRRTL